MLTSWLLVALGVALLYLGADWLVRGSAAIAARLGLTPLVIGLTVVAFGTSMPEMVVSVGATIDGNGAIAMGNVVGSNIGNIALILGLSALVRPPQIRMQVIRVDLPIMILATLALVVFLLDGQVGRPEGALLLAALAAYTVLSVRAGRAERQPEVLAEFEGVVPRPAVGPGRDLGFLLAGLVLLVVGARALTLGAVAIAEGLGIGQVVIGLTIVAIGTSLPELATSLLAASRGEGDLAIGNVIGSNTFNVLGILGTASLVRPVPQGGLGAVDLAVMVALALLLLPLMRTGFRISRLEGGVLLLLYVGYLVHLIP
jgi:cation:H+ antiporter